MNRGSKVRKVAEAAHRKGIHSHEHTSTDQLSPPSLLPYTAKPVTHRDTNNKSQTSPALHTCLRYCPTVIDSNQSIKNAVRDFISYSLSLQ